MLRTYISVIFSAIMVHTSDIFDDFRSFSLMICSSFPPINESMDPIELPNANLARDITSKIRRGDLPDIHLQTMSASRARQVVTKSKGPWLNFSSKILNLDISSTIICVRRGTLLRLKRTPMCRRLCACSFGSL